MLDKIKFCNFVEKKVYNPLVVIVLVGLGFICISVSTQGSYILGYVIIFLGILVLVLFFVKLHLVEKYNLEFDYFEDSYRKI